MKFNKYQLLILQDQNLTNLDSSFLLKFLLLVLITVIYFSIFFDILI